ncbi:hypothetical protein PYW07_006036 [Mythimna separata]|uniref:ABC transporter domain-containing protein n=1 Tax=Mythimna separata TaxID=271217 RepID=A0AAD7YL42_MYTSE|nr:hypothetical protein PYW07_006036 [Mythimna separata]
MSLSMMESDGSTIRILYSPHNAFTQTLMTRVEDHLDLDPGIAPKHHWVIESKGFPLHHNDFFSSDAIAEVRFKNHSSFRTDLDYSLYAVSDEAENALNGEFGGLLRTITPKEEIAPSFLPQLQWAIDKSYMELLSDQPIKQVIKMSATPTFIRGELLTLHRFMTVCTILGPLPFYIIYSNRLIVERKTGLKELMKHAGITSNVLRLSHVLEAAGAGTLYCSAVTILLKITWQPLLPESNAFIIGFTLLWHFVNTMSFAFIATVLSQDPANADCLGLVLYLSTFLLDFLWHSYKEYTFILCCILPHAPIYLFWDEVVYLERLGVGTQFTNIFESHSDNYSVLKVWLFFCTQLFVTISISWYFDLTRPGYYGVPKKWNFFMEKKYWYSKSKPRIIQLPSFLIKRSELNFESKPKKAEIAVQVLNVSKVFQQHGIIRTSKVIALDSVTFDCYKGEVTIILGGNGAGKTTLMLIVAGMFKATEGTVFVEGFDVADRVKEIRHNMRLCMQQNVFFKYLTVKENIMFFKKLKGKSSEGFTVQQLLKNLKLLRVANEIGSDLSSGNMRCLQVACVLASDPDVLVLDEPTTSMDLEERHRLWDVLMVLRNKKTILMTTTCLEEANVLGDRIAILDKGVLKCHGSPTFLKNVIGTSFTLAITLLDGSRFFELKEMVDAIIPNLECRIHDMRRVAFLLPTKEFQQFPTLFEALEDQKTHFGIVFMDVAMFMEEVFTKFIETGAVEPYSVKRHRSNYRKYLTVGYKLVCLQMALLIRRLFTYTMKTKGFFFILRFGVTVICILITTLTSNYSLRQHKLFSHQVAPIHQPGLTRLVYNVAPFRRSGLFNIVDRYMDVRPVYSSDIDTEFRRLSKGFTNQNTLGFKITDNFTKIYHSMDPKATSKSVNLFSNVFMAMYLPQLNKTIRTTYETLPKPLVGTFKEVKSKFLCVKWACWLTFISIIPLTPLIMLCLVERICGIRDTHMMAGCTPRIHWGSKLLAHMIVFSVIIVIPTVFFAYSLDYDNTFIHWQFFLALAGLLIMFGLAFHSYLYLLSFILNENTAIGEIIIASLLFGVVLPMLIAILELFWRKSVFFGILYVVFMVVGRTAPQFVLGVGLARLVLTARLNAYCEINRSHCPNLEFEDENFDAEVCCSTDKSYPFPFFVSYGSGLYDLINLIAQFVIFATLVILMEYRIPQYLYEQLWSSGYKEPKQLNVHNVAQETAYVRAAIKEKKFEENVLLVKNVHKDFKTARRIVRKKKSIEKLNVVRGVSFAVKLGQSLAIVGPHSAGKTSLLNMLSGTMVMTRGDACVNGIYIRRNRMKVFQQFLTTT